MKPCRLLPTIAAALAALPGLAAAQPESARPLMKDFMGINGHTVAFKPELYKQVCSLVRDYHPIDWDLGDDPHNATRFPFARNMVNWEDVYGSWKKAGFRTVDGTWIGDVNVKSLASGKAIGMREKHRLVLYEKGI